ncbi:putative transcription factor SOX-14 [Clonorchis sinensis]|uniref:Sex-determining region Y protein n=1 Tax=Clonorchis sinensis TaxID=79923 RepID=G7YG86_CLOSI|nr:putative transcription factor SOX-14 [Clonorchis sinensis]
MFQATDGSAKCKSERVHSAPVIPSRKKDNGSFSELLLDALKSESLEENSDVNCLDDCSTHDITKNCEDEWETASESSHIDESGTVDEFLDLKPCKQCSVAFEHSLDIWMDHLVDRHPIPKWWPSARAIKYDHPYTAVVGSNKKRRTHVVPRPLNSFMIFAQYIRRVTLRWFPEAHNVHISQRVGFLWRHMPAEIREEYAKEAVRLQSLHSFEFPDYKYRPKKRVRGDRFPQLTHETVDVRCASNERENTQGDRTSPSNFHASPDVGFSQNKLPVTALSVLTKEIPQNISDRKYETSPIKSFVNDSSKQLVLKEFEAENWEVTAVEKGNNMILKDEPLEEMESSFVSAVPDLSSWTNVRLQTHEGHPSTPPEFTIQALLTDPLEVITQPIHLVPIPQLAYISWRESGRLESSRKLSGGAASSGLTPSLSSMSPDSIGPEAKLAEPQSLSFLSADPSINQRIELWPEGSETTEPKWDFYSDGLQHYSDIIAFNVPSQKCDGHANQSVDYVQTPSFEFMSKACSRTTVPGEHESTEMEFMDPPTILNISESLPNIWRHTSDTSVIDIETCFNEKVVGDSEKYLPSIESWTFAPLPNR